MSNTPSPARRRGATAIASLLASAAVLGAMLASDSRAPVVIDGRERDVALARAAASGDPLILAAIETRADANTVFGGDPHALAGFETVRPAGALTALPATGDPVRGSFSPVVDWPLVGIHAALTPDGRVLTYGTTTTGVRTGFFVYDVWDPRIGLGMDAHTVLPNQTAVDLFCNAQLLLPDGNIEMWGGDVVNPTKGSASLLPNDDTAVFDPLDDSLVRTGKMWRKRWYATATMLPSGEVYLQGGTGGADFPEVRTGTGTFRLLSGAPTAFLGDLYPRNFLAPDGNVFGMRYEYMYKVDPAGTGAITRTGNFSGSNLGGSSTALMFRPGRILQVGGGYDLEFASPLARIIDINGPLPVEHVAAPPLLRRHWANSTVLADGRVFLSGGSVADNDPVNGVGYASELYDPEANAWSPGATAQRMRLYHSASLLLPDATVLTLGGGANGPQLNLNAELYFPPYLFRSDGSPAPRPVIATATMTANPSGTLAISTPAPAAIARVTLVKAGAVTHSFDMDQRFLELAFTVEAGGLRAQLPANPFETPPGYYLLFIIDVQGVPSEAMMVRIAPRAPARLTVNKVVVNDQGGTSTPSSFRFSINGGAPIAFEADGSNVVNLGPGTYAVIEPATPGYDTTYAGCSGIVLAAGGTATCSITNNDRAGVGFMVTTDTSKDSYLAGETVTMTARVLNNGTPVAGAQVNFDALKPNGINHVLMAATTNTSGNASASFVSGSGPSSIGTYQLTTRATSGSLSGTGTATFAVLKPQATLTVTKVVVNDDDGTATPPNFNFSVNGATAVPFEPDGSNVLSVAAGTYTVTEPAVAGYTTSYANCSGIVLVAGGTAACTITNNDTAAAAPATLTVNKIVVNDDGGSARAPSFGFSVNGAAPVAFEADGSNVLSLPAGTYSVTEPAVAGYAASLSNCTGLVLAAGGSATCTITNNDTAAAAPATLTVNKIVVNDDGGGAAASAFSFAINGGSAVAFEIDGSNSVSLPPGTYTVTEPAVAGYATSYANCSGIVLVAGGNAACTITNNDTAAPAPATLTVNKIVVNDDGGTASASSFGFSINGAAPVAFEADGSNAVSLPAGTYSVTEPAVAGYTASLSNCAGVVLDAGGSATCTITNNDTAAAPATLTVNKIVVNDDGGSAGASSFGFSINGAAPVAFEADGSNEVSVPAGTYSVSEPAVTGYAASLSNCSGIVVSAGGGATCTITNNDIGAMPVLVVTTGSDKPAYLAGETVTLTARVLRNGDPVGGAQVSFNALKPNGVNRVILAATTNASGNATASFVSGSGSSSIGTYQLTTTASSNGATAQATATFTVARTAAPATLTVRKLVVNDDGGTAGPASFRFSINGAAPVAFEADGSNAVSLAAGTYSVTEPAVAGYATSLSNCTGIVLAAGGSATCTITNNDTASTPASLTVNKVVVNDNGGSAGPGSFSFSINGAAPVAFETDGNNVVSLAAGTYSVTEPAAAGYATSLFNCTGIVLAAGGNATCTITNNDTGAAPALSVIPASSKPVYTRGETVTLTARVLSNGQPVSGVRVNFDALKPNLVNHVILSAVTNTEGNAVVSFVSGVGPSSIGTYQLTTTVTVDGATGSGSTTFVVQ